MLESSVMSCVASQHLEPGAALAEGTALPFPLGISPTAIVAAQPCFQACGTSGSSIALKCVVCVALIEIFMLIHF